MKNRKDIVYYIMMAVLLVVFAGSGGMLLTNYLRDRGHEKELEQMASRFPQAEPPKARSAADSKSDSGAKDADTGDTKQEETGTGADGSAVLPPLEWKAWWEEQAEGRFTAYASLMAQNPDMAGWVRIEGTKVDYPVMQSPASPEYYLHRDFDKKYSNYGIPFMEGICRCEEPRTSLLIYGHHMKNGAMFAALQNYTAESYYRQHPYIQFDTADQAGSYEIALAVKVDAADTDALWRSLLFPADEAQFDEASRQLSQQAFYQTGVPLFYTDRLLALVTCEYSLEDGRLMVVAREIQ